MGGGVAGEGAVAEAEARRRERRRDGVDIARKRILKILASLTAHWHDKGADWRGLGEFVQRVVTTTSGLPSFGRLVS